MRLTSLVMAAVLAVFALEGCGSSGTGGTSQTQDGVVTVRSGAVAASPSHASGRVEFTLSSDAVPAQAVYGVRFTFTLPEGLEPVLVANPYPPAADTVEVDPARVGLSNVFSNAVVVASYRKSTRKVQVGLIDADGFESLGAIGVIYFAVSNPALPQSEPLVADLLLEEVISTEGPWPAGYFTLTAAAAVPDDKPPF